MKAYTDVEESRKLAEILPLDSADMHYSKDFDGSWFVDLAEYTSVKIPKYVRNIEEHLLPCWSLTALLEVIREKVGYDLSVWDKGYSIDVYDLESGKVITELYSNPVDAVVETIYKLREKELI